MDELPKLSEHPTKSGLIEIINEGKHPVQTTERIFYLLENNQDGYQFMMEVIGGLSIEKRKEMCKDIKNYISKDSSFKEFYKVYSEAVKYAEKKENDDFKKFMFEEKMNSLVENKNENIIEQVLEKYYFATLFITPDGRYRLGKDGKPITLEEALCVGDYKPKEGVTSNKRRLEHFRTLALNYLNR